MALRLHTCLAIPDNDVVSPSNDLSFDNLTRTSTGSSIRSDTAIVPTGFDNSYRNETLASEECTLRSYQSDIKMGTAIYLYIPSKPTVVTNVFQVRSITVGAFNGRSEYALAVAPDPTCQVLASSNGANLAAGAFASGTGTLNTTSTTTNRFSASGTISVPTTGGTTVLTYTGKTSGSFTGCQWISGSGTVATNAVVTQQANLRLALPSSVPWVTTIPYPVASWFRFETYAVMGTANNNGELHGGIFLDPADTVADDSFASTSLDTGIQSERIQYEVTAYGTASAAPASAPPPIQWVAKSMSGGDVGAIGTNGFTQPGPDPDPDPDPDPEPPPTTNTGRVTYFIFDGTNLT